MTKDVIYHPLLENLNIKGTLWLLAVMCITVFLITWLLVPETRSKTLEEIENYWYSK